MTLRNRTASSVLHWHPGNNHTVGDVVAHALKAPNIAFLSGYAVEVGMDAVVVHYPWSKFNLSPEEYECIVAELRVKGKL